MQARDIEFFALKALGILEFYRFIENIPSMLIISFTEEESGYECNN